MLRRIAGCGLLIWAASAAAFAQKAGGPTFDVASIKPAAPMQPGRIIIAPPHGGPGTNDPGQVSATNASLNDLLMAAYNVKRYQISGPEWLDSVRFDVVAKVPAGASKDDVSIMWRNLLIERFALELHHTTKEMPMFALTVAKGGVKMKESTDDELASAAQAATPGGPDGSPPPPPPPPTIGKDGMPVMPRGMGRPGGMMMIMMNGRMRMMGTAVPISSLVENLNRQFDRPVTDQTGLTKKYDIQVDFSPEGLGRGMPMPPPGGGMMGPPPGGGGGDGMARAPESGELPTLAAALQEQLGLKLETKKGPVDMLVIDHVEKAPVEN